VQGGQRIIQKYPGNYREGLRIIQNYPGSCSEGLRIIKDLSWTLQGGNEDNHRTILDVAGRN
jgi:hypothetical protein